MPTMDLYPTTRDILVEFIEARKRKPARMSEICQSLISLTDELKEFINEVYHDRFREAIDIIDPKKPDFDGLEAVAHELLSNDITWFHILTFLYYGSELASRMDGGEQIINWMCNYIDQNLSQWIGQQEGGWSSINSYRRNRGQKNYLGVAAFAGVCIAGGIYLCSKFIIQ